ncbi:hypothetical protein EVAR_24906_1 [Eumeta japonica]|uniref:Uncharacterized protein n=1 Tax=Eumeta variegata TaxID=151549 RepID=A0A4C1V6S2_EUMVA|nr:hypothetical protein EVAR_24906_1 [Eumeta japonica]
MQAARHRGHYGRAERVGTAAPALPDSEVSDAPRAYHAADGGAPTRTSWEQLLWLNRCFGALVDRKDDQTRAGARRGGHRLADACVAEPSPALVNPHSATRCPHPPLSACAMTRAPRVARRRHRLKIEDRRRRRRKTSKNEEKRMRG